jgi:hypothetical protein
LTGTTVLHVENSRIAEEIGLGDEVTALQQLGILKAIGCLTWSAGEVPIRR